MNNKNIVKENDLVYLYHSENSRFLIKYKPNKLVQSHKGHFTLPENLKYGDMLISSKGLKYFVLHPSHADKMMKVERKNTIIYPKEAGKIIIELGIKPDFEIIELGTGSGALTILFSNLLGNNGFLYTYEINEKFIENAKKNVERYGNPDNVEFYNIDVYNDSILQKNVDAIFVDLPEPWQVVEKVYDALKFGAKAGFLSPNIEQVQKTIYLMEKTGFKNIHTFELWERRVRVKKDMTRPVDRMVAHTAYLYFANKIKK